MRNCGNMKGDREKFEAIVGNLLKTPIVEPSDAKTGPVQNRQYNTHHGEGYYNRAFSSVHAAIAPRRCPSESGDW
jgi:hypothetical protein